MCVLEVYYNCNFIFQIGSLKNHYHLRHDEVKELHREHAKDKTDLLVLEKEVRELWFCTSFSNIRIDCGTFVLP